jgi:transposase
MGENEYMSAKNRRVFSEEFKAGAVRLVDEEGKPATQVARDLGIHDSVLSNWLRIARANRPPPANEAERDELERLRKEVRVLRMERDILKKATAYFAKNST